MAISGRGGCALREPATRPGAGVIATSPRCGGGRAPAGLSVSLPWRFAIWPHAHGPPAATVRRPTRGAETADTAPADVRAATWSPSCRHRGPETAARVPRPGGVPASPRASWPAASGPPLEERPELADEPDGGPDEPDDRSGHTLGDGRTRHAGRTRRDCLKDRHEFTHRRVPAAVLPRRIPCTHVGSGTRIPISPPNEGESVGSPRVKRRTNRFPRNRLGSGPGHERREKRSLTSTAPGGCGHTSNALLRASSGLGLLATDRRAGASFSGF